MPCTSAVRAPRVDRDHAVEARRRRGPGRRRAARGRNRFEVRLASRTGAPAGIASYDARSRRHRLGVRVPPDHIAHRDNLSPHDRCARLRQTSCVPDRDASGSRLRMATEATTVPSGAAEVHRRRRRRRGRGRRTGRPRRRPRRRAEHHDRLEAPRAAGDRHRDATCDRGELQRRQVDGRAGVGAAVRSRTQAPSAARVRARVARARVTSLASSGSVSARRVSRHGAQGRARSAAALGRPARAG